MSMLYEVGRLYAAREDFVFLAWSPHWMNRRYDIRYLEDPKDALGPTNDPAECSTIVRGGLREGDPVAYAFMDALALTEGQIDGLEYAINKEEDPVAGARRWVSENREDKGRSPKAPALPLPRVPSDQGRQGRRCLTLLYFAVAMPNAASGLTLVAPQGRSYAASCKPTRCWR